MYSVELCEAKLCSLLVSLSASQLHTTLTFHVDDCLAGLAGGEAVGGLAHEAAGPRPGHRGQHQVGGVGHDLGGIIIMIL